MEREILDKIVELIGSQDFEMQSLAKAMFILHEPTQEDYLYLDSKEGILKSSFPERYLDDLGRSIRGKLYGYSGYSGISGYSGSSGHIGYSGSIPVGIFVTDPTKTLKLKPNP